MHVLINHKLVSNIKIKPDYFNSFFFTVPSLDNNSKNPGNLT